MAIYHMDHPCALCKKPKGNHLHGTGNCPMGKKSKIGYTSYSNKDSFKPKSDWKPKVKTYL